MQQTTGFIELITGVMFSGKSTRLLSKLKWKSKFHSCLFIQSTLDTRKYISRSSHLDKYIKRKIESNKIINLHCNELPSVEVLLSVYPNVEYIFVDEGQFYNNLWVLDDYASKGKKVYVASLLFTSEQEWFNGLIDFYPLVDRLIWCNKGKCNTCGKRKRNVHTVYFGNKTNEIEVGDNIYGILCRECLNKQRNIQSNGD